MLTSPTGGIDTSDTSGAISHITDPTKSAFMEIQQPYANATAAAAVRGAYSPYMQYPTSVTDFYGQHTAAAASRLGYPLPTQYSSTTSPFTQSFTNVGAMGNYHSNTNGTRENGK